jgi:hypothetical protein
VHSHVLGDFAKAELKMLDTMIDAVAAEADWMANGDRARFLTNVAGRINPPRPKQTNVKSTKPREKDIVPTVKIKGGNMAQDNNDTSGGVMADALKALADKLKGDK